MAVEPEIAVDLDPAVVRMFEAAQPRSPQGLHGRELWTELGAAAVFVAAAIAFALIAGPVRGWHVGTTIALVVGFAALSRVEFDIGVGFTVPTELMLVPLLFLVPLTAVPPLVALGLLLSRTPGYIRGERHPARALLVTGDALYAFGPAIVLAAAGADTPQLSDWPIYAGALVAQGLLDYAGSTLRVWLADGVKPSLQLNAVAWVWFVDLCLAPIGLLTAIVGHEHPEGVVLVLPLAGLLAVFARERHRRLEQSVALSGAYRGTALLLGDVIEDDDAYTGQHTRGVVDLAVAVADAVGTDDRVRLEVEFGALLHDVGKLAIPKEIINKPGPLDDDEWVLMRTHTIEGERMLARVGGVLAQAGRVVRASHERWDGGGYPDGLSGREIPYAARIVAVCDAYSAMTTDRSYRAALGHEAAITELRACAGTQFDPDVVESFIRTLERVDYSPE